MKNKDIREFASQMKVGELAVWIDDDTPKRKGEVLLRTYSNLVLE